VIAPLLGFPALVVAGLAWMPTRAPTFVEHRMSDPQDAPIAIAAAKDGTIWFTIDHADAIGRIRDGRVERLPTQGRNMEPIGLAVAAMLLASICRRARFSFSNPRGVQSTTRVETH